MINTITFTECHDSTQPVSALHKIKKIQFNLKTYHMKEMPQGLPYSNPKPPAGSDKHVHQMSHHAVTKT